MQADAAALLTEKIIRTVLYFEVFTYPVTLEEICQYQALAGDSKESVEVAVAELLEKGWLFRIRHFYLSQNRPDWVQAREQGNKRADNYLKIARRMSRLIAAFPYVRAVFVSGSLSKHHVSADGDIDYFIITRPGRLWLARTLLVLFKKLFLFNSHKYFCVNYFIDEAHLEIEEKNLYTAMEVVTLLPMYGSDFYDNFCHANEWAYGFYPHYPKRQSGALPFRLPLAKRAIEALLNTAIGDRLDAYFMQATRRYWQKKFHSFSPESFDRALKSRRYVSKHHPNDFQQKVLERYEMLIQNFEAIHPFSGAARHA